MTKEFILRGILKSIKSRPSFWNCIPMKNRQDTFSKLIKLHILRLSIFIQYSTNALPVMINTPELRWYYLNRFQSITFQGIRPIAFVCWLFCQRLHTRIHTILEKKTNLKIKRQKYHH